MLYSTLLAGLLTTSAIASPLNVTAPLEKRAERKYCDAEVLNADPPNNYCYQFCDTRASRVVGINPIAVTGDSDCATGPEGGCPITSLRQEAVEVSTTKEKSVSEVKGTEGSIEILGAKIGGSYQKWVEHSTSNTRGTTKTEASTNWLYVPLGKQGHVVFFPYYTKHCGFGTTLRKPNLYDETNFDCNPDYKILINHDADVDRIRGMRYDWIGVKPGDAYNWTEDECILVPVVNDKGIAAGRYQVCDSDNTDNACKECKGCDPKKDDF